MEKVISLVAPADCRSADGRLAPRPANARQPGRSITLLHTCVHPTRFEFPHHEFRLVSLQRCCFHASTTASLQQPRIIEMERPRSLLRISRHAFRACATLRNSPFKNNPRAFATWNPSKESQRWILRMERRFRRDIRTRESRLEGKLSFERGVSSTKAGSLAMLERGGGERWNMREKRRKGEGVDEGEERVPLAAAPNWPASRRRFDHASFLFLRSFSTRLSRTSAVNRFFLSRD